VCNVPRERPSAARNLGLTLLDVHKEPLAQPGPDTYFAYTDFRATDCTILDVDF
jgi:hypothetical protein